MTRLRLLTLVTTSALLGACGGSSQPTTNIAQHKNRVHELGESDWATQVTNSAGAQSGKWVLELKGKAAYLVTPDKKPFSTGQVVSTDQLKFGALPTCPGQSKPTTALYTFHIAGSQLTVTPGSQSDSCKARSAVLTAKPWSKVPVGTL